MASTKATVVTYTEKELAAIAALTANRGVKMTAAELGVPVANLNGLVKKMGDERPMAEGIERVIVNKEKVDHVCSECGAKSQKTLFWID